jgi:hypothetical protein
MNNDSAPLTQEGLLKALDLIHLSNENLRLLGERKLDKDKMAWAVRHLPECYECCAVAPVLTAHEIESALTDTDYGRPDLIEQTIEYYFETLKEIQ